MESINNITDKKVEKRLKKQFKGYELCGRLSEGDDASGVYLIKDKRQKTYAVKVIRYDINGKQYASIFEKLLETASDDVMDNDAVMDVLCSLLSEIYCMKKLRDSEHIMHYNDYKVWWDSKSEVMEIYLCMPYMPALAATFKDREIMEKMSPERLKDIMLLTAEAVYECHKNGIIHMDIKMENFFEDGARNIRLGDFGSACSVGDNIKENILVTKEYAAPEVLKNGIISEKADVYALGKMYAAMLEKYFQHQDKSRYMAISALCDIIDRMTDENYGERTGTVKDVITRLNAVNV